MATPSIADLENRNAKYAQHSYQPRPFFSEMPSLGLPPLSTIIVTCADPRICPEQFLDLQPGEAIVFRTAGGHVRPILQDILTLDSFIGHGTLSQLVIVHHTDCGASHFSSLGIKNEITARHPEQKVEIEQWNVGAFGNRSISESVEDDMDVLLQDKMVSDNLKSGLKGYVLDIKTGLLEEVSKKP